MKIAIINGPNLNLLGKREPSIYGHEAFEDFFTRLQSEHPSAELTYFQSNVEGEIINKIHEFEQTYDGIILNAASYSHTSVGISDAIAAISIPTVEVHISNIYARETYRHHSITGKNCVGVITGLGLKGYELALNYLLMSKKT
jgi:3-dehydroquinate dehydratase-2